MRRLPLGQHGPAAYRRTEQNVQGIPDNLGDRPILGEYDICHTCEIVIEKGSEYGRLQCLDKRSETFDVCE